MTPQACVAPQASHRIPSDPGPTPGTQHPNLRRFPRLWEALARGWAPAPPGFGGRGRPSAPAPPRRRPGHAPATLPLPVELAPSAPALTAALQGDGPSWDAVLAPLRPRLVALAAHRIPRALAGRIEPEDLVQETFVRILEHNHTFEEQGPTSFLGWTVRLLENAAADAVRHHRRQRRTPARESAREVAPELEDGRESGRPPLQQLLAAEERVRLARELDRLDREDRRLLAERFQAGATFAHIAGRRSWSESTARRRLGQALDRLRQALGEEPRAAAG